MNVDPAMPETPPEVFLGCQPVLDKHQQLAGHELIFRAATRSDQSGDPRALTADIVCDAFAELGLPNVLGRVRAFIDVDAAFLNDPAIELLPKDFAVITVGMELLRQSQIAVRCRQLRGAGFDFAIGGLAPGIDALRPLLDIASYLKVDITNLPGQLLRTQVSELRTTRRTLIAAGVESAEQMELCSVLGFDLFQGRYFAGQAAAARGRLDASTRSILGVNRLLSADADIGQVEAAFRAEPALVVSLLRLTHLIGAGARTKIGSVRHAIEVLGPRSLRRWLRRLLFRRGDEREMQRDQLMQYAALRGRFLELLAERAHPGKTDLRDSAFIAGLISVMPAAMNMSITDILAQITVAPEVRLALARREGALGQLLALTDAYDDQDVDVVRTLAAAHPGFGREVLGEILAEALGWVRQLDAPLE